VVYLERVWAVFIDRDEHSDGTLVAICATPEAAARERTDPAYRGARVDVDEWPVNQ